MGGGEDWRQLGPGWYFLENWKEGPIRWTGRQAEVYLSAKPKHKQIYVRVYTGDTSLGERITGSLKLAYSLDRISFVPFGETPFDLSAEIWFDLVAYFSQTLPASGVVRLQIQLDQSRIPAQCISGSTDTRELGLAVAGMALE